MKWLLPGLMLAAAPALAQNADPVTTNAAPPAEKYAVAPGGVDMRTGRYAHDDVDLSIGDTSEVGGLVLKRSPAAGVTGHINPLANFTHNWDVTLYARPIDVASGNYTGGYGPDVRMEVSFGGQTSTFQRKSSETYYSQISYDSWATLTFTGTVGTFTAKDGTIVTFRSIGGFDCSNAGNCAYPAQIVYSDGTTLTFEYETQAVTYNAARLRSIVSNHGYAMLFEYGGAGWNFVAKSCVINLAATVKPSNNVCPTGAASTTYGYGVHDGAAKLTSVIDNGGSTWLHTYAAAAGGTYNMGFVKPGASSPWMTNTVSMVMESNLSETEHVFGQAFADGSSYGYSYEYTPQVDGQISSVAGGSYTNALNETTQVNYAFPVYPRSLNPRRTYVEGIGYPASQYNVGDVVFQVTPGPAEIVDPLGRKTEIDNCDPVARQNTPPSQQNRCLVKRVHSVKDPDGVMTFYKYEYSFVTEVKKVAKPGSGLADIVVSATYNCTPTTIKSCDKPVTSTDAKGAVTNYTYSIDHGGVLTETRPASSAGADRPQKRYDYGQFHAWYKNASGTLVQSPTPVWLPTAISECSAGTSPACIGTAAETRTTFAYGAMGAANNLLLAAKTVAAGDGSLSATTAWTYDEQGNKLTEDGPLPGTADTTRWRYDSERRVIGEIGPDPDGAGPLKHRAIRNTYNAAGELVRLERGTTADQSDAAWAAFTPLEASETAYDSQGRKVREWRLDGSVKRTMTHYRYDLAGRLLCIAVRMDPAQWDGQTDACVPQTSGPLGPDRVTKNSYDAAGQLLKVTEAFGTDVQADEETRTFTPNGKVETLTDGEGNRTTYVYDGHDRLFKMQYPSATTPGTSNVNDWEGWGYDANGNVIQQRRRDGDVFINTIDALNRTTVQQTWRLYVGNYATQSYAYDLAGRLTSETSAWPHTNSYAFDALGRKISETDQWLGTQTWQYDLAGRLTRATWADGTYVDYDRFWTGEVGTIRLNGAYTGAGVLAGYAYDDLGRRFWIQRGNGTATSFTYDAISRLVGMGHDAAGTANDVSFAFTYNPAGQIATRVLSNESYAYTENSNKDVAETPNGLNQLVSQGGTALTYDLRGNVTGIGGTAYGYDAYNRMTQGPGGAMVYDTFGRLFYNQVQSALWRYTGGKLTTEQHSTQGWITRRYVRNPDYSDEVLTWFEGSYTDSPRWLLTDERGSTIAVTDASGAVTNKLSYDDYGTPASTNPAGVRFQYTGQAWLPELGLHYYKARMYHPGIGRFMQIDPSGYDADGPNLYAYVGGDPINGVDPDGRLRRDIDGIPNPFECRAGPICEVGTARGARTPPRPVTGQRGVRAGPSLRVSEGGVHGGHTLRTHVGRSLQQMRTRLAGDLKLTRTSTFINEATANAAYKAAVSQNQGAISRWLNFQGGEGRMPIKFESPVPLGTVLMRGEASPRPAYNARFFIEANRDPFIRADIVAVTGYVE